MSVAQEQADPGQDSDAGLLACRDPAHDIRGKPHTGLRRSFPDRREEFRPAPRMGLSPHRLPKSCRLRGRRLGWARVRLGGLRSRFGGLYTSGQFVHFFTLTGATGGINSSNLARGARDGNQAGHLYYTTMRFIPLSKYLNLRSRLALSPAGAASDACRDRAPRTSRDAGSCQRTSRTSCAGEYTSPRCPSGITSGRAPRRT